MRSSPNINGQIQNVSTFEDLVANEFRGSVNAICWNRKLEGDFAEIVGQVEMDDDITELNLAQLDELNLSQNGQLARKTILSDMKALTHHGALPSLNVIRSYERDDSGFPFPTDVYSYHIDRSTVPSNTFLCTYFGTSSDILPNEQATQKILIPKIRAELRALYDGEEDGFEDFLREYFFDLHYQAKPDAQPVSLGLGNLWKLAIDHPERQVPPCLHRAPKENPGQKRLLLIC